MFNSDTQRASQALLDRAPSLHQSGLAGTQETPHKHSRPATQPIVDTSADPFELNQSIWSSAPNSAGSFFSHQNVGGNPPLNATQVNNNGTPQNNNAHDGFYNNLGSPTSQGQSFAPHMNQGLTNLFGARRASAIEPYQLQQLQAAQAQVQARQFQQDQFSNNGNYTLWPSQGYQSASNGFETDQVQNSQFNQWQPQMHPQGRNSAPETAGFFNTNRRHQSFMGGLERPPDFNEGVFDNQQIALNMRESTQAMTECYQKVDYYFTDDPYKRVSITADTIINSMSTIMEQVVNSGAQLPRFSSSQLPSTQMVLVSFKSGRVDVFYLPENSKLNLKIGDLVVVEADRGKDLGKVLKMDITIDDARLLKFLQHQEQQAALASFDAGSTPPSSGGQGMQSQPSSSGSNQSRGSHNQNQNQNNMIPALHFPKPILRLAQPSEVYQVLNKQSDEDKAKQVCALKVDGSSLNMRVVDAEYQWDRRKLTFYYSASHRIDFRELVRELFRIYKTRIWMCAVTPDAITDVDLNNGNGVFPQTTLLGSGGTNNNMIMGNNSMGNNIMNSSSFQDAVQSPSSHDTNLAGFWANSPSSPTAPHSSQDSGQNFQPDLSMQIPRQFSSPDKSLWD